MHIYLVKVVGCVLLIVILKKIWFHSFIKCLYDRRFNNKLKRGLKVRKQWTFVARCRDRMGLMSAANISYYLLVSESMAVLFSKVLLSGPNTAQKWQWLLLLVAKSLLRKFNFFLACLYFQKLLKTKILIKNGIILILKSILKECCTYEKAKHICLD